MIVLATIEYPAVIRRILTHLGLPAGRDRDDSRKLHGLAVWCDRPRGARSGPRRLGGPGERASAGGQAGAGDAGSLRATLTLRRAVRPPETWAMQLDAPGFAADPSSRHPGSVAVAIRGAARPI